jgi:hypothetical protein
MAGVRMTRNLRNQISGNGFALFSEQVNKAQESLADDFWQRVTDAFFAAKIERYLPHLPLEWVVECSRYHIDLTPTEDVMGLCYGIGPLIQPVSMPNISNIVENGMTIRIRNKDWDAPLELRSEATQWKLKTQVAEQQRHDFVRNLDGYLNKCNTVKQFLATWSQGEELLPDNILKEHLAPNPAKAPQAPRPVVERDSTQLNAGLLRQKIMQNT